MDYKYIEQLLEHYWKCETSLEEEKILRAFFSQKEIPAELLRYKDLFTFGQREKEDDVLGDDFDEKILAAIDEQQPVKARVITMTQRLMPLFKAAAVVAIFLTLGNAAQVAFNSDADPAAVAGYQNPSEGPSVALNDSTVIDTLKQSNAADVQLQTEAPILK